VNNFKVQIKNLFFYLLIAGLSGQSDPVAAEKLTIQRDEWYLSQPEEHATIQMSGHKHEQDAIAYIEDLKLTGDIGYYQTQLKGHPWYAVTFGSFSSLDEARSQLQLMPEHLQKHSPWPRKFKAIKALIDVDDNAVEITEKHTVANDDSGVRAQPDNQRTAVSWQQGQAAYDEGDFVSAFKIWQAEAKKGDELSQFNLGVMYSRGEGTEKNGSRALEWYMRSAAQGYAPAQFNLGTVFLQGVFTAKDEKKAAAWWQMAAEQGFVQAQFNLASLYCQGIGVPRDIEQCKFWYGRAASNGDTNARKMLDRIKASEIVPKPKGETVKTAAPVLATTTSAKKQSAGVKTEYAPVTVKSTENRALLAQAGDSLSEQKRSEKKEEKTAMRRISATEQVQLRKAQAAFTRNNYMKSHDIWLPLAESGIAEAQYSLGFLYQSGWGPERDLLQAVEWYSRAAEQNETRAQFNLGVLLINGEDEVEKDTEAAIIWLTRSADGNNIRAKELLIDIYSNGKYGIEKSTQKAEYWKSR
jgi:TPR repeat protein